MKKKKYFSGKLSEIPKNLLEAEIISWEITAVANRDNITSNEYKGEKYMNQSFLELLEAEKRAFLDAKYSKKSAVDFLNKAEMESNPEKRESCKRIASEYENLASKYVKQEESRK